MKKRPNPLTQMRDVYVKGYTKSPELLAMKVRLLTEPVTEEKIQIYNQAIWEIQSMVGLDNLPVLCNEIAKTILTLSGGSNAENQRTTDSRGRESGPDSTRGHESEGHPRDD
jgi:hypothetical protein